jgi:hypothetical protein
MSWFWTVLYNVLVALLIISLLAMLSISEKKVKCFEHNAEINEAINEAIKTKPENASIYTAIEDILKLNCTK